MEPKKHSLKQNIRTAKIKCIPQIELSGDVTQKHGKYYKQTEKNK